MQEWVKAIAKASDDTFGSRRMKKRLNCLGYPVSRNKAKLPKQAGSTARYIELHIGVL